MDQFFSGEGASMDLRAGLAAVRCPVLVVAGEVDPIMLEAMTQELAAALPTHLVRYELLPGVSHLQVGSKASTVLVREFIFEL